MTHEEIEKEILQIKGRNARVEGDKAWETSILRRTVVAILTYAVALAWLFAIGEGAPFYKAIIPVAGYILSTLSLGFFKAAYLRRRGTSSNG